MSAPPSDPEDAGLRPTDSPFDCAQGRLGRLSPHTTLGLRRSPRIRLLRASGIHRVQPDARDAAGFLHQIAGELAAFPGHHRTRGQRETQSVCLILEIQNNLSRHSTSPRAEAPFTRVWLETITSQSVTNISVTNIGLTNTGTADSLSFSKLTLHPQSACLDSRELGRTFPD